MQVFLILTIGELVAYGLMILFFGITAIAGGTALITNFLARYFIPIVIITFLIIIVANFILGSALEDGESKIMSIANTMMVSIFSFPLFYMFLLEFVSIGFVSSTGFGKCLEQFFMILESIIGIVITCVLSAVYMGLNFLLLLAIDFVVSKVAWLLQKVCVKNKDLSTVNSIITFALLFIVNVFLLMKVYRFYARMYVNYYCSEDALEIYKENYSNAVYKFSLWVMEVDNALPW